MAAAPGTLTPGAVSVSGGRVDIDLSSLGRLVPLSRSGGQGRVYAPEQPLRLASTPLVVKLYRVSPGGSAVLSMGEMVDGHR